MDTIGPANLVIIIATVISSVMGFRDPYYVDRFIFRPEDILGRKEYYRLVTSAFLHGDWTHLIFNLISLYFFGTQIELMVGIPKFLAIYFGSIVGGGLLSLWLHRNHDYRALGASGGVCGVIYASIMIFPEQRIYLFLLPFGIPAWLYAILFLGFSFYGIKAQRDNIGHDAHLGGAICGLLVTVGFFPALVRMHTWLFVAVLGISALLLVYLWLNPLMLSPAAFWRAYRERRNRRRW